MRRLKRARDLRVRREVGPRDRRRRRRRERRYRTMERCVRGGVYAANRAGDRNNNRGNIITGSWGGGAVLLEDSIRTGTPAIARNIDANDF